MNEKKADNIILSKKEKIDKIDDILEQEKKNTRKLENLQESFHALNGDILKCLELISKSIKGSNVENTLDDIRYSNNEILNKSYQNIDSELKQIKKRVNKLYSEKEELIKEKDQKEK